MSMRIFLLISDSPDGHWWFDCHLAKHLNYTNTSFIAQTSYSRKCCISNMFIPFLSQYYNTRRLFFYLYISQPIINSRLNVVVNSNIEAFEWGQFFHIKCLASISLVKAHFKVEKLHFFWGNFPAQCTEPSITAL